jgi:GxxExxY protein
MSRNTAERLNHLTSTIIGCAIEIHKKFGSGLLENAYCACVCHDLVAAGLRIERHKPLPLVHGTLRMPCAYRADIVVEDAVVIEIKAVENRSPVWDRQVSTYLRLGDYRVGLLLNFGAPTMREGIVRIVNDFPDE